MPMTCLMVLGAALTDLYAKTSSKKLKSESRKATSKIVVLNAGSGASNKDKISND